MTRKAIILIAAVALLSGASPARADELDDAIRLVEEACDKILGNLELVQKCMGMSAKPEVCDAADGPGTPNGALKCPGPGEVSTQSHECSLKDETTLEAALGAKAKQLLKLSGKFTTTFKMIGEEKSIPEHLHQPDGSNTSCGDKYVKRQDKVSILFAAYQSGSVEVPIPTELGGIDDFVAKVGAAKGRTIVHGPISFCIKIPHPQPRSCARDCNTNNVPDPSDTGNGTSSDCDHDGIPDECESNDCDGDGILDSCDIQMGLATDCNHNGIPDRCEIAGNWVPTIQDSPTQIVDAGVVSTPPITINAAAAIAAMRVGVEIQHAAPSELLVELLHDNVAITLAANVAGGGNALAGTIFDDAAALPIHAAQPPFAAAFRPSSPLSTFAGHEMGGEWRLRVTDTSPGNNGAVIRWWVQFALATDCNTNAIPDACDVASGSSTDCNANGTPDECETVALASSGLPDGGPGGPNQVGGPMPVELADDVEIAPDPADPMRRAMLTSVEFYAAQQSGAPANDVALALYPDAGGMPAANPALQLPAMPAARQAMGQMQGGMLWKYTLANLNLPLPSPGRWWLSVRPIVNSSGVQYRWVSSHVPSHAGSTAHLRSAAMGFPTWTSTAQALNQSMDLAFRVNWGWIPCDNGPFAAMLPECRSAGHVASGPFTSAGAGWTYLGAAAPVASTGAARLVRSGQPMTAGAVCLNAGLNSNAFEVEFDFRISNVVGGVSDTSGRPGPDGLTFFVADSLPASPGGVGRDLGYGGFPARSFAVEFDAFQNPVHADPDSNHVGIDLGGSLVSMASAPIAPDFESAPWHARIRFEHGRLLVFVSASGASAPAYESLAATIPAQYVPSVKYLGFASGTGLNSADTDISQVRITRLDADCNGNGVPDECDIARGTSADADANGIPDECESACRFARGDANGDTHVDGEDIPCFLECLVQGTSACATCACSDMNADGLVDQCDLSEFVLAALYGTSK